MLQLLPRPNATQKPTLSLVRPSSKPGAMTSAPSALVYTLLRHGRGLSHKEAESRLHETLDGPFQAA
jgi:hypothetical protein